MKRRRAVRERVRPPWPSLPPLVLDDVARWAGADVRALHATCRAFRQAALASVRAFSAAPPDLPRALRLPGLARLTVLDAGAGDVELPGPMPALRELRSAGRTLTNLAACCPHLRALDLEGHAVANLAALPALPRLRELSVRGGLGGTYAPPGALVHAGLTALTLVNPASLPAAPLSRLPALTRLRLEVRETRAGAPSFDALPAAEALRPPMPALADVCVDCWPAQLAGLATACAALPGLRRLVVDTDDVAAALREAEALAAARPALRARFRIDGAQEAWLLTLMGDGSVTVGSRGEAL